MDKHKQQIQILLSYMSVMDVKELCGFAKLLGVKLLTENISPETRKAIPRDGEEIVLDCLEAFEALGRTERRRLIRILGELLDKRI